MLMRVNQYNSLCCLEPDCIGNFNSCAPKTYVHAHFRPGTPKLRLDLGMVVVQYILAFAQEILMLRNAGYRLIELQ